MGNYTSKSWLSQEINKFLIIIIIIIVQDENIESYRGELAVP
jgi:hypothetical protein